MRLRFSSHAIERFKERFPDLIGKDESVNLAARRSFEGATLDKSFLNDSRRIVYMMETYGDYNYDFYIKGKVVFVVRDNTCITVIPRNGTGMVKMFGDVKPCRFRKKKVA
jgi:hypothetical protein